MSKMIEIYLSSIAVFISVISLIISVYFQYAQKNHNEKTRQQLEIGLNQTEKSLQKSHEAIETSRDSIELSINTEMNQARYKLYEVAKELSQFKKDFPKGDSKEREQIFKATVENLLNQYEILCDYYLSNRINKDRFIKQRKLEIKQIVESEGTKEYFANPLTSNYQAVIEVYRELKNTI